MKAMFLAVLGGIRNWLAHRYFALALQCQAKQKHLAPLWSVASIHTAMM